MAFTFALNSTAVAANIKADLTVDSSYGNNMDFEYLYWGKI
jgi:hypothetical protein